MPQLDVTTYFSQIFWFLITFTLLFVFIKLFFTKRINFIFTERALLKQNIENKIVSLKKIVQKLHQEHADGLDEINNIASDIINDALAEIEEYASKLKGKYKQNINFEREQYISKLANYKDTFIDKNLSSLTNIFSLYIDILTSNNTDNSVKKLDIEEQLKVQISKYINELKVENVI